MPLPTGSRRSTATHSRSTTTERQRLRPWLALGLLALQLGLGACGGGDLLLPQDGEPARISVVSGDNQSGTVGRPLGDSLVVKVTDSEERPVSGIEVVFTSPAGAGVAPNDTVLTGSDGRAAVRYTLSTTAGEQMVEARAIPIVSPSSSTTTFRASAQPESAEALVVAGGEGQTAQVATVLPESLAVRAVDRFGNGVAGIEVTWEASSGGDVSPSAVTTGSDGRAATQRRLGDRPGSQTASASADDLEGSPVTFTATAMAAPRPELVLVTQPSPTAAAGVPFERQPELQLQDPVGAPLNEADVSVTVQVESGGGSLGGRTTVRSDASGRVRFTDLEVRGEPGPRTLIFAADGFTPTTSATIAVSPGPPAAERSSASVPNGTAGVGTTITIRLEDEFGTAIEGAAGAISISVAGANQVSGLAVSENGDGSYSSSYVPTHTGTDLVDIRVGGTTLSGSPFASAVSPGPAEPATTTAVVTRRGVFFVWVEVVVTTRDSQGNLLAHGGDQVQVIANGSTEEVVDNQDGTYSSAFFIVASSISVDVTLNGVSISGSPFTP